MMLGDSIRRRSGRSGRVPRTKRDPDDGPGLGSRVRAVLLTVGLSVLGFFAAYLFATLVLYPPAEALGEAIEVPGLVGNTVEDARQRLRGVGLTLEEAAEIPDGTLSEGVIVAQTPLAGQALRPGAAIQVAVSAGPPRVRVPNLLGFEQGAAVAILQRAGFTVERSEEIADEPPGRVARIQPAPGSELRVPATVLLVISSGPPDAVEEDSLITEPSESGETSAPGESPASSEGDGT